MMALQMVGVPLLPQVSAGLCKGHQRRQRAEGGQKWVAARAPAYEAASALPSSRLLLFERCRARSGGSGARRTAAVQRTRAAWGWASRQAAVWRGEGCAVLQVLLLHCLRRPPTCGVLHEHLLASLCTRPHRASRTPCRGLVPPGLPGNAGPGAHQRGQVPGRHRPVPPAAAAEHGGWVGGGAAPGLVGESRRLVGTPVCNPACAARWAAEQRACSMLHLPAHAPLSLAPLLLTARRSRPDGG